jgi:hypothetical protein
MSVRARQISVKYDYEKNVVALILSRGIYERFSGALGVKIQEPRTAGDVYVVELKMEPVEASFTPAPIIARADVSGGVPELKQSLTALPEIPPVAFAESAPAEARQITAEVPAAPSLAARFDKVGVLFEKPQTAAADVINEVPDIKAGRLEAPPVHVSFQNPPKVGVADLATAAPGYIAVEAASAGRASEPAGDIDVEELERLYERHLIGVLSGITPERPGVILATKGDVSYIEFLKRILREIYRVRVGGLPVPRHVSNPEDLRVLLPIEVGAGNKIFVIEAKALDEDKEARLRDRMRELFSQGFGFIVLYGDSNTLGRIKALIRLGVPSPIEIPIIDSEFLKLLARFMWGDVEGRVAEIGVDVDTFTVALEDAFWERLGRCARDFEVLVVTKPSSNPDEVVRESMTHYLIKAFVVRYLAEELARRGAEALKCIATEYRHNGVVFDVYIKKGCGELGGLAVEVETLYGTGTVVHKLLEVVESRRGRADKLWIIVPNPEAVLYLPLLLRFRKKARELADVELYTLDVYSGRLIRLIDVAKKILKEVAQRVSAGESAKGQKAGGDLS